MTRPIGIDLFAGAGGLSLGFEQAGFEIAAAVELDPIHAAVHHYNFPFSSVLPRSVVDVRGEELLSVLPDSRSEVDVVFGGPPCQGFSMMGQRMLDDSRNVLVREFVRLTAEVGAKYFVLENVKGLTIGKHLKFLEQVIAEFELAGYQVQLPWRVLDSREYGVPQHRERLFLIGCRKGLELPAYPLASHYQERFWGDEGASEGWVTCEEALSDLPDIERYDQLLKSDELKLSAWNATSEYAREMHCIEERHWHYGHKRVWDAMLLSSSMRTKHTRISQKRFASTDEGTVEPISRFYKLPRNGQCNTLRAGTDSSRGAFTSPRPIHYRYPRCISVREMARLHGFPDWFRFHVTKWHGARQIGNSVPPPLARAVASCILKALDLSPEKSRKRVELGSTELLKMDATAASRYWRIKNPIGKRDRKSGLRKRKQEEIDSLMQARTSD